MQQVDFNHHARKDGFTIYRMCFQPYGKTRYTLKKPKAEWMKLIPKTEAMFDFLIEQGIKFKFNVNAILQIPDSSGSNCCGVASLFSEKICRTIIERGIKFNTITVLMHVPELKYPELAIPMMKMGINPHIIDLTGTSSLDRCPKSFQNEEAKRLLSTFPRSMHFSIEDLNCSENCQPECNSKFKKFFYKNGPLVEMTDDNKIGRGGFGMVFRQSFHGKQKAMKCLLLGKIERRSLIKEIVTDFEKNISEIRIQIATAGSGVIVPEAFVRQQIQEKDENGKWIAKNYNIYIYPLYDCNLYELHKNKFDQFTEEIVGSIIYQCFTRNGSSRHKFT